HPAPTPIYTLSLHDALPISPWCGPCRMLSPLVDELSKEYDGKVKVGKFNTDDNPQVATRYKISAIPTLLFFKGGNFIARGDLGIDRKSTRLNSSHVEISYAV